MQLKQLKLAGFKSFVDPTIVPFPSQLVAVVGPNGCGKSNIIDAVRWVMGESLAKNLRGDSMVDVIFKGSSNRKPIGQASVELIFDNSMGRLTGQYASYHEISVKRLVTQDGESTYYLNGGRCRRRDITDIFLGTGASARGYSIIGQDTISRIVEARPEDLRVYLEEAAGVSKYKERRRETIQRIGQTRENLTRIADIREELEKQLGRLERQAKAAERYLQLKQEEHLYRTEIVALKWQAVTDELQQVREQLQQITSQALEQQTYAANEIRNSEALREQWYMLNANNQQMQADFYQLTTEITRLEDALKQRERDKQRMIMDKESIQREIKTNQTQIELDNNALQTTELLILELQNNLHKFKQIYEEQQQIARSVSQCELDWNTAWQKHVTQFNQEQRDAEVSEVRLQHLHKQYQQLQLNFEKNQMEQSQIGLNELCESFDRLQTQHATYTNNKIVATSTYQQTVEKRELLRQQLNTVEQQLRHAQDKLQSLTIEHAALSATQKTALNSSQALASSPEWDSKARLAELISVQEEWLVICELILGDCLKAIVFDSWEELRSSLPNLKGQAIFLVEQNKKVTLNLTDYSRLADKITPMTLSWQPVLENIFTAQSIAEALVILPHLSLEQSVVTIDGYWFGKGWVRVFNLAAQDDKGLLSRKKALQLLANNLLITQQEVAEQIQKRDDICKLLMDYEEQQALHKESVHESTEALKHYEIELHHQKLAYEQATCRHAILLRECESIQAEIEECALQRFETEAHLQTLLKSLTTFEVEKEQLLTAKQSWEKDLHATRDTLEKTKDELHCLEIQAEREISKAQQLQQTIHRNQSLINNLLERLSILDQQLASLDIPTSQENELLAQKISYHTTLEQQVAIQSQEAERLRTAIQQSEQQFKSFEQQAKMFEDERQKIAKEEQALVIRKENLVESMSALEANLEKVLATISTEITSASHEEALLTLQEKIKRLGAINLLAIEEYQADLERKTHLDTQYNDLNAALSTLETAIARMDKETEQRLKITFEEVNRSFQTLFPRLFGGGYAQLELTCGNLLEAGILVKAQPPGKRNTTIQMLSGGEKAMTAVALVFAIFQLNPSPFCMLDEVDAPLDEANVRRFCELVKEMSVCVQFLFITHNKITMELADHLIGVTMREPGVSRVVAVDVESVVHSDKVNS